MPIKKRAKGEPQKHFKPEKRNISSGEEKIPITLEAMKKQKIWVLQSFTKEDLELNLKCELTDEQFIEIMDRWIEDGSEYFEAIDELALEFVHTLGNIK